jgi:hypothetical protein
MIHEKGKVEAGRVIAGRYRVLRPLGEGSGGAVFVVEDIAAADFIVTGPCKKAEFRPPNGPHIAAWQLLHEIYGTGGKSASFSSFPGSSSQVTIVSRKSRISST